MAQYFDGENFEVFDAFQLDRQNLTRQIIYVKTIQHLEVYGERQ